MAEAISVTGRGRQARLTYRGKEGSGRGGRREGYWRGGKGRMTGLGLLLWRGVGRRRGGWQRLPLRERKERNEA